MLHEEIHAEVKQGKKTIPPIAIICFRALLVVMRLTSLCIVFTVETSRHDVLYKHYNTSITMV